MPGSRSKLALEVARLRHLWTITLDSSAYCIYSWSVRSGPLRGPLANKTNKVEESPVVTKKEIVKTISEEIGLTQLKTKEIVQKTFDAIVETLVEERRIELRNFGVFEVKERAARKARNPRTGQPVYVAEKFVVTFKPGKEMEEKVRQLEAARREREARAAAAANGTPAPTDPASGGAQPS
ncbi:histone family protein DNA-binding protein [Pirellula staleyi DSM 6068]|uniref:Histone family protein DNA-binding protein n=1 Tax=Pirellula staleyi (strain ATCC 27377 / DSM 6068 / ICPB 4128) TaxID=530564 RepID=D2QWH5_PIRSD|nr:histone family protein DNA-binding protein [Pirellula staleyi DSM 6068]